MAQATPDRIDILDFQFKLHCRLKIFKNEISASFEKPHNLVSCASRFGLVFVGSLAPSIQVIQLTNIECYTVKDGEVQDYVRRSVSLPSQPKHLSLNCDHTKLAIVVEKFGSPTALIYEVASFVRQEIILLKEIRLSASPGVNVVDTCWNPTIPDILTVCKDDGSLGSYEFKQSGVDINELPAATGASSMCWSPKGKQIAVGCKDGKIIQCKPDMKPVKMINAPPFEHSYSVAALQWISNYQFIAMYQPNTETTACLIVVDAPKSGEVKFTNYEDICYSYGTTRPPQFYFVFQAVWNTLLVASSNSVEVGVLGFTNNQWIHWILGDAARAELPLSNTRQDTLPIGMALDTGATQPLILGENTFPPVPYLFLLSHHGILCCFKIINTRPGAISICQVPETLPNANGLVRFTSEGSESFTPQPAESKPIVSVFKTIAAASTINTPAYPAFSMPQPSQPIVIPQFPKTVSTEIIKQPPQTVAVSLSSFITTTTVLSKTTPTTVIGTTQLTVPSPTQEDNAALRIETEALIGEMVREECFNIESELKMLLHNASLIKIDLGSDSEATYLVRSSEELQSFVKEVTDTNATQAAEVYCLKQGLVQTWAWYEEARSQFSVCRDPTMTAILRAQPLDPVSKRHLADITHLLYYLESQLSQANASLDEQWEIFQDSFKKTLKFRIPTMETIFQTMVRQTAIIQKQMYILKDLSSRIRSYRSKHRAPSLLVSVDNVDHLEVELQRLCFDTEDIFSIQYEKVVDRTNRLSKNKIANLRKFLTKHNVVHVSVAKSVTNSRLYLHCKDAREMTPSATPKSMIKDNIKKALFSEPLTSLLNAGVSPVQPVKQVTPIDFIQSTPKVIEDATVKPTLLPNYRLGKAAEIGFLKTTAKLNSPQGNTTKATSHFGTTITTTASFGTAVDQLTTTTSQFNFALSKSKSATSELPISGKSTSVPFNFSFTPSTNVSTIKSTAPVIFGTVASNNIPTSIPVQVVTPKFTSAPVSTPVDVSSPSNFGVNVPITSNVGIKSATSFGSASSSFANFSTSNSLLGGPMTAKNISTAGIEISIKPGHSLFTLSPSDNSQNSMFATTTSTPVALAKPVAAASTNMVAPSNIEITNVQVPLFETGGGQTRSSIFGGTTVTKTTTSVPITQSSIFGTADTKSIFSSVPSTTTVQMLKTVPTTKSIFGISSTMEPSQNLSKTVFKTGENVSSTSKTPIHVTTVSSVTNSSSDASSVTAQVLPFGALNIASPTMVETNVSSPSSVTSLSGFEAISSDNSVFEITSTNPATTTAATKSLIFGETSPVTVISNSIFEKTPGSAISTQSSIFGAAASSFGTTKGSIFEVNTASGTPIIKNSSDSPQASIFGTIATPSTVSVTPVSVFGAQIFGQLPATTINSIFGPATTAASFATAPTTTPSQSSLFTFTLPTTATTTSTTSIFGTPQSNVPTTTVSTFVGSTTAFAPSPGSIFQTPTSSPAFSSSVATTSAPQFGVTSTFGTPTATSAPSPFGAPSSSVFGTVTTSSFGSSAFEPPKTTASNFFGSTFGSANPFGSTTTTPGSIFAQPVTFGSGSIFGGTSNTTTSQSVFSNATSSVFGSGNTVFGQPATSSAAPFGSSVTSQSTFGTSTSPANSFSFTAPSNFGFAKQSTFGFASQPPTVDIDPGFGPSSATTTASSAFGSNFQTQNPFAKAASTAPKPFVSGSIFATPAATTPPAFGGSSFSNYGSTFGSSPSFNQQPGFGQASFGDFRGGNSTQSGPFSGGGQTVSQSGFGASPTFQKSTGFGASPSFGSPNTFGASPTFGGNPTFGGSPTFGSSKVFGTTPPASTFGVPAAQENPTFGNLANQTTLGFGALAQQTQAPQVQQQSSFSGGSSFSSWR